LKEFRDKYDYDTWDSTEKGLVDFYNSESWFSKKFNQEDAKKGSDWKKVSSAPANTSNLEDDKYYVAVTDEKDEIEWKEFSEYAESGENKELYGA
jgi:hypothetical protein